MKTATLLGGVLLGAGLLALPLRGSEQPNYPTFGKIERLDPRFDKLIPKDAAMEKLADGFLWTEGPVWVKDRLLFSDIPNNVVNAWVPGKDGVKAFLKPAGYTCDKPRLPPEGGEPGSN